MHALSSCTVFAEHTHLNLVAHHRYRPGPGVGKIVCTVTAIDVVHVLDLPFVCAAEQPEVRLVFVNGDFVERNDGHFDVLFAGARRREEFE